MPTSFANDLAKQHTPEKLVEKGRDLYKEGKFEDALEFFTAGIIAAKPNPAPFAALNGRSHSHIKLDKLDNALLDARRTIDSHRSNPAGYILAGIILKKTNKDNLAAQVYASGIRRCPVSDTVEYKQLRALLAQASASPTDLTKREDPVTKLPVELLQNIFLFTSFRTRCACLKVSSTWRSVLASTPSLWHSIDLSEAKRPVRSDDAWILVRYSMGRARQLVLNNLALQGTRLLDRMTTYCKSLESLTVITGGELDTSLTRALNSSQSLKTLHLCMKVRISIEIAAGILGLCPLLTNLQLDRVDYVRPYRPSPLVARELKRLALTLYSEGLELDLAHLVTPTPVLEELEVKNALGGDTEISSFLGMAPGLRSIRLDAECMCEPNDPVFFFTNLPQAMKTIDIEDNMFCSRDYNSEASTFNDVGDWQEMHNEVYFHSLSSLRIKEILPLDVNIVKALLCNDQSSEVSLSNLDRLAINCGQITLHGLNSILTQQRLSELKMLDLSGCQELVDANAMVIVEHMKLLRKLNLSGTQVTGVGIKALVEALPDLHHLTVIDCTKLGPDAVEWARAKGLRVVSVAEGRGTAVRA